MKNERHYEINYISSKTSFSILALQLSAVLRLKYGHRHSCAHYEQTGETTLVALAITPRGICGASVGDSITWLVKPNETRVLTSGQYKGFLGSISTPVAFQEKKFNGTILLATDGVWKYSDHEQLQTLAQLPELDVAAKHIVESARLPSGAFWDDTTIALCRAAS